MSTKTTAASGGDAADQAPITRITYVGPHDAVDVAMPPGSLAWERTIARGESLTTTADHAAALLDQPSNWAVAGPEKE